KKLRHFTSRKWRFTQRAAHGGRHEKSRQEVLSARNLFCFGTEQRVKSCEKVPLHNLEVSKKVLTLRS
ncbi:MAG: hypothetical protein K2J51_08005, partial [Alistipes sp.]|nr:hypothetical protein [Alistipes sp.]